jgi:carboxymethylenebutenolidase
VAEIRARMLLLYAERDDGVNATRAPFEAALKAAKVPFTSRLFPGTQHGFHNDSTPRYDPKAASEAWELTLALFRDALAG